MLNLPKYTHPQAMCKTPVPVELLDHKCFIIPLSLAEQQVLCTAIRDLYVRSHLALLPHTDGDLEPVRQSIVEKAASIQYDYGDGAIFTATYPPALTRCIYAYILDPPFSLTELREWLCPKNVTTMSIVGMFSEIKQAVTAEFPNIKSKLKHEPPIRFLDNEDDERTARMYRALNQQYHWTFDDVSKMTPYQIQYALLLLPEEEQHLLELEAMRYKNKSESGKGGGRDAAPLPVPKGTVQMTPEQYQAFLADRQKQG